MKAKILSDLVHFGHVTQIALRLFESLPHRKHGENTSESLSIEQEGLKNLVPICRLLDAITMTEGASENLDFLIRRLERMLREKDNYELIQVNQLARLLRAFAQYGHVNVQKVPILDKLVKSISMNIDKLLESDVF